MSTIPDGPRASWRRVLAHLEATSPGVQVVNDHQIKFRCLGPSHANGDRNPSGSATYDPGKQSMGVYCHVGCDAVAAHGIDPADLFDYPLRADTGAGEWTPVGPAVAVYDYTDENSTLLFQVTRTADKQFRQRRPEPAQKSGWAWSVKGVRQVPYRLPLVTRAVPAGEKILVLEGEKDVHTAEGQGHVATCNAMGAGKWRKEHTEALAGAVEVWLIADDDTPGHDHIRKVAKAVRPVVKSLSAWLPAEGCKDYTDHVNAGHGLDDLRPFPLDDDKATGKPVSGSTSLIGDNDEQGGSGRGPSQASQLAALARDRYELFMSEDGRPYGVKRDGPNIALPLRGKAGLRSQLAHIYTDANGGAVPSQSALADAMTVLEGVAQSVDPRVPHLRVARTDDERIVIDLATSDGRCVIVNPDGTWDRVGRSPVLFRRSGAMKPLPDPVKDGDGLAKLEGLLNTAEDGFRLLVAWMVAAFIPGIPHPILTFRGEQGTGKSFAAKLVIGIIDPSGAPKRTAPRDVKSWATQAFNSWALCLDNVSLIPDWLSDALCRAVTGDGMIDRALYTDDDVVVLEFRRVLAMTTIDAGALAGDLAERLLTIELHLISDSERREETELDRAYADAHAAILASLFDLLAEVLKVLPNVELTERPRMADFARVLAAVDQVKGWKTLDAYQATTREAVADVLEGEPFAKAVVDLVDAAGPEGLKLTASELLSKVDTPDRLPKKWPKDPTRAGGQIKRLAPALRTIGIEVDDSERGSKPQRQRLYKLTATAERRRDRASGASPGDENRPPTSENRGDASETASASPRAPRGDAATPWVDADPFAASPYDMGSDLHEYDPGDAGDVGDAAMRPLSGLAAVLSPADYAPPATRPRWANCAVCGHRVLNPDIGEARCVQHRQAS